LIHTAFAYVVSHSVLIEKTAADTAVLKSMFGDKTTFVLKGVNDAVAEVKDFAIGVGAAIDDEADAIATASAALGA
jgi:hypothetical protein